MITKILKQCCDGDEDGIHASNRRQKEHISGRNEEDDENDGLGASEVSTLNRYLKNKKRRMAIR